MIKSWPIAQACPKRPLVGRSGAEHGAGLKPGTLPALGLWSAESPQ